MTRAGACMLRSVSPAAAAHWRAVGQAAVRIEAEVGCIVAASLAGVLGRLAGHWPGMVLSLVVAARGRR